MDSGIGEQTGLLEQAAPSTTTSDEQVKPKSEEAYALPDKPLIVIEPSRGWAPVDLRDLWAYRELLYFLTWRDLKVRYKQTVIGVAWVIMQPLLSTLIFTIFLGKLARVPSNGIPYALFAYAGLLPWTFYSSSLNSSGNSIVGNAHLITKVYFPRVIIPAAAVAGRIVDFAIAFTILVGMMFFYGVSWTASSLMLIPLLLLLTLFALGTGMWISALNVKYRDVGIALPVLIQLWMFVSPVLYPASLVPPAWRVVYDLNPLVGLIENFRAALFNMPFNWRALAISTAVTFAMLIYSAYAFRRMEKEFADVV